jgi:hypothetical protein
MSDDQAFEHAVDDWLADGSDRTPQPAVDAVLLAVKTTPQERDLRIPWRTSPMSLPLRLAAGIAIIAVIGFAALTVFRPGTGPGVGAGPTPTPSATPAPTSTPTSTAAASAGVPEFPGYSDDVAPGTYLWPAGGVFPADITFTIPSGWISRYGIPHKDRGGPAEMAVGNWVIANVYADPCQWQGSALDPAVGPTVDDLASALVAQKRRAASPPTDVTLSGYPAKRIELSVPADLDPATCDEGVMRTWFGPGERVDTWYSDDPEARSPLRSGQLNVVYIVDVNGGRLIIDTWHMPGTSAADLAELDAILASMRIEP